MEYCQNHLHYWSKQQILACFSTDILNLAYFRPLGINSAFSVVHDVTVYLIDERPVWVTLTAVCSAMIRIQVLHVLFSVCTSETFDNEKSWNTLIKMANPGTQQSRCTCIHYLCAPPTACSRRLVVRYHIHAGKTLQEDQIVATHTHCTTLHTI